MRLIGIGYQIIACIVGLVICVLILANVIDNINELKPELTAEQQECEHEWECIDVKYGLNDNIAYIYCPKCKLEDTIAYKEWNKIRADQNYEKIEELKELME